MQSPSLRGTLVVCGIAATALVSGCATPRGPGAGAPKLSARDQAVQLQIFLDAESFGPGVVDGHPGEFTAKALARYLAARDLPPDYRPDVSTIAPYTTYTVTDDDVSRIGPMAVEPADLAKQKRLPYEGMGEVIAERFHTTRAFLYELNPGQNVDLLGAGDALRVPNVARPLAVASFPSAYSPPSASVTASRRILVDTNDRMLEIRDGGRLIAAFPITPGSAEHPAPVGEWKIAGVAPWPWFRYDEGVLKRGERTSTFFLLPPGPNSPVGLLWIGLNRPGTGIHGTAYPETIGRSGSHGCIRLANWDATRVYTLVRKGMPVTIL